MIRQGCIISLIALCGNRFVELWKVHDPQATGVLRDDDDFAVGKVSQTHFPEHPTRNSMRCTTVS